MTLLHGGCIKQMLLLNHHVSTEVQYVTHFDLPTTDIDTTYDIDTCHVASLPNRHNMKYAHALYGMKILF